MSLSKFVTNAALMATMPLLLSAGMLYRSGSCIRQGDQIFLKLEKSDLSPLFVLGGLGAGAIAGWQFWTMAREEEGQGAIALPGISPLPSLPASPPIPPGFYDWRHLPEEATGIFLAGDPGSGKTALVQWLIGLCTEVTGPSQLLIFDTHNHDGKWPQGATILSDEYEILETMRWILDVELKGRKQGKRPKTPLIWVCDELGDLAYFAKKKASETKDKTWTEVIPDFLICAGSQGRKYEFLGVFINQGANVKAVGMEGNGDYLESYHKIFLGRLTEKWGAIQGVAKEKLETLKSTAYPVMIGSDLAIHPTHGCYQQRAKKQPPKPSISYQPRLIPMPSDIPFSGNNETNNETFEDYPEPAANPTPITVPSDTIDPSKLFEISRKHGWVTASKARTLCWNLRQLSPAQVRELFQQLSSDGQGYLRNEGEALEWRIDRVTD